MENTAMKKIIAKAGLFFIILTWISGWLPGTAAKAAYTDMEGASIIIQNAAAGDLLCGYRLLDVSSDAAGENFEYTWTAGIEDAIKEANGGTELSADEFVNLEQREKHAILSEIRSQLDGAPELPVSEADGGGTVSWGDVPLGGYMIVPENTVEVYQIMFALVYPVFDEESNSYQAMGAVIDVKTVPIGIVKKADSVTTGKTHAVEYSVTADLPTYASTAIDKYFGISDKSDEGIDIDSSSIRVFGYASKEDANDDIGATEFGTLTQCSIEGLYTPCEKLKGQTVAQDFALEFDYDKIPAGISVIKIVYQAQINESAMVGSGGNRNTAGMVYTVNPFVISDDGEYYRTKEDEQTVYTYQLQIVKTAADDKTARLSGAEFDLYRRAEEGEKEPVVTQADIPQLSAGNYVLVAHLGPTGQDGTAGVKGLDVGIYYLVETKAPDNYQLLEGAVKIELSEGGGLDTESGAFTAVIENVKNIPPYVQPPKEGPKDPPKEDPPKVETPKTADFKVIFFFVLGATLMAGIIILGIFKTENESER